MHMADALLSPAVGGVMIAASGIAAGYSVKKVIEDPDFKKKIPMMGVMGAFVFATQMINFTIPGTGSSGHLCGGMLLTAVLGPYAGFLSMIGVLLIQCLFFADGGLLAIGANVWNMAFYGCFVGSLIWKAVIKNGATKLKIVLASVLGCVLTLQMGAFSVTLETMLSGITELPFGVFLGAMLPIHLAIGLVEGLITAAVLVFVHEARPALLWQAGTAEKQGRFSYRTTLAILTAAFLVIGGGVSLLASQYPDGLEWSIEKLTGNTELEGAETGVYETAAGIQETTSFLPDYAFKDSESALGTSVSGVVGCAITFAVLAGAGALMKIKDRKKHI